ncbi:MAG: glutamine synthetase type III, partial [Candidatus Hydrogenedentes bacterium]|nr:glutamine synthetase type III [Candidatus Hydrogenedentota bacterium]
LSRRETESRYEVYAEQYVKTIKVEASLMLEMAKTIIFPAAIRYQSELAVSLANLKAVGIETDADTLKYITKLISDLQAAIKNLTDVKAGMPGEAHDACDYSRDSVIPAMVALRKIVDELEGMVADDLWPLPTYQEMLFIK